MNPKISVAIPTFVNNESQLSYLKESFDRIKHQTFTNFEVVVSDNSHNDYVDELCKEYSKFFSILYEKNLKDIGMSANSNYVLRMCNGEYIKILHYDDFLFSDKSLEIIVNNLDNTDKCWMVNGFNHTTDSSEFFDPRVPTYPTHLLIGNNLLGSPSNSTIRRKNLEYYDVNLHMGMDVEWYHRIRMKYGMPLIVNDILSTSRIHTNRTTSTLNLDIVIETEEGSWENIESEINYIKNKHKDFFETWEYPND